MRNFFRQLLKPKYDTFNRLEINAARLLSNWRYLKSVQPRAALFPVLKSNAYGHGLREVCGILNGTDAPLVAVDSYPEAQIVYDYFKGKVLIIGEMPLGAYGHCRLDRTEFVVYNEATLRTLARYGKKVRIHLFVNTGMNREGVQDLPAFISRNQKYLSRVEVSGFCSHLASAEENGDLSARQEERFVTALGILRQAGFFPRWIHLGNSAAIFTLHSDLLTAFRPGLAFYGYDPLPQSTGRDLPLQPALEIYSRLVSIQDITPGAGVSYNETYRAAGPTRIGVIPFGYFEGLDRRLSNAARFRCQTEDGDRFLPVAGQICMNLTCIDIGENKLKIGDSVQIVSARPADPNSVANLAALSGTIPHEFLAKLQASIHRQVI